MQEIGQKYPDWLRKHRASLDPADLQRYTLQHRCIQELCKLYEEEPDNFDDLYAKMQQARACRVF